MSSEKVIELVSTGKNVLLLGPGGCGKTYSLKRIFYSFNPKSTFLTATTGIAAFNICEEAKTLHSFAGVGIGQGTRDDLLGKVISSKWTVKRWKAAKILIIDEISMLGEAFFNKLDYIAKFVRQNELPMGGIQIIASGDFLQLPPVKDEFVFRSEVWNDLNFEVVRFEEPKRYDDVNWFNTLSRIRIGETSDEDDILLKSRMDEWNNNRKEILKADVKPTILYSKRINVEGYNRKQLDKINEEEIVFEAFDYIETKLKTPPSIDIFKKQLEDLIPSVINLKVGAQVMVRRNFPLDPMLVNGTRGVIVKILDESVIIKLKCGVEKCINTVMFELVLGNMSVIRCQIPLTLAWAATIHKSQGLTIDLALCNIGNEIFEGGQSYVALSRVKNVNGLYLSAYERDRIFCNDEALEFDKSV